MTMRHVFLVLAVLWTLAIMTVCWMPMSTLAHADGPKFWMFDFPYFDKLVHFGIFLIFATLWYLASTRPGRWITVLVASTVLAALTEIVQKHPMIGRQSDFDDAVFDVAGAAVGLLLIGWLSRYVVQRNARAIGQASV